VFTGGGLIRKPLLDLSNLGVINCHMGKLPSYRGMDVVEWTLLEKKYSELGFSIHIMDEKVDTGNILKVYSINKRYNETLKELRERYEPMMCKAFANTVCEYLEGKIIPKKQAYSEGRQYFAMHSRLKGIVREKLKNY